jgi:hypothetical protein
MMKKMNQMKKLVAVLLAIAALSCGWAALAGGAELGFYGQGDVNLNGPAYVWWYGCTPTSAGMMMGYYDIHGYGGLYYDNLVPGGVAEASTFPLTNPWDAKVKNIIASQGYVTDFYRFADGTPDYTNGGNTAGSYNNFNDDQARTHNANSLADYMGSGQDWAAPPAQNNPNGNTWMYYWPDGHKFTAKDAVAGGLLGMDLYFRFAGYGTGVPLSNDTSFFTQLIWSTSSPLGATFSDYKAMIDAGLVVMIQVEGHSMFGYGYQDSNNQHTIIFRNTWDNGEHFMNWGGSYAGMDQWGITAFTPSVLLMISGLAGLAGWRVRFRQK